MPADLAPFDATPDVPNAPVLASVGLFYPTITAFYNEIVARRFSGEIDYGVLWNFHVGGPTWHLSYIARTGELYIRRHDNTDVVVVAVCAGKQACETALDGWADICGADGSMHWLANRLGPIRLPAQRRR